MFENLVPVISQVNPTVLMVLAGAAIILFVVSLIKKAVKVGIYMLILAIFFGGGIPAVNSIKESYDLSFDKPTQTLTIKVAGIEQTLPMKEILADKDYKMDLVKSNKSTQLSLTYKRADGTTVAIGKNNDAIAIPNYMAGTVMKFLDKNNIRYTYRENTDVLGGTGVFGTP